MTFTYEYTTYEAALEAINAGVRDCLADFGEEMEISEDEIFVDMAASVLIDAEPAVAREVCRVQIGYVPQSLETLWKQRRAAQQ